MTITINLVYILVPVVALLIIRGIVAFVDDLGWFQPDDDLHY